MTLIGPHGEDQGGRPQLEAVVAADHHRVASLVAELRHQPPTFGVTRELRAELDHEVEVHLGSVERVLWGLLPDRKREAAATDHDRLRAATAEVTETYDLQEELDRLELALGDHVARERAGVLAPVEQRLDRPALRELGLALGEQADALR